MLILFDIDGTLLTTAGVGIRAMGSAGRRLYGEEFDERAVEYAGRLDPLIINDLLVHHGVDVSAESVDRFRRAYAKDLEMLLAQPGVGRPCPGVVDLVAALEGTGGVTLGLLTGNYPETGAIKLQACGLDAGRFPIAAWGSDSPHIPPAREHLPPVAMERLFISEGRRVVGHEVVIIGDTRHDVACGRAHGCRTIGVATGSTSVDALRDAGADLAVETLAETSTVLEWILAPVGR